MGRMTYSKLFSPRGNKGMPDEKQIQPVTEFEHFLNRLSEADLQLLNRMVVERLKLYHKARDLKGLAKFNLMDRVYFVHDKGKITGIVTRLNRRSVTALDNN
jgi:hypothetical protein